MPGHRRTPRAQTSVWPRRSGTIRTADGSRPGGVDRRERRLFWLLAAFLVLLALMGGGSRPDILSLVVVRPVAILVAAFAAWSVTATDLRRCRFALILLAAMFALTLAHLVPLPPALWGALPGRALVTTLDRQTGLGAVWRPISLVPPETRNALFSLFVPLAVLLAGVQLGRARLERLLLVVLAIVLASALLGGFQLFAPPTSPLFLYQHINFDAPTGLFANRNHQAILLVAAFPMLAAVATAMAQTPHATRWAVGAFAVAAYLIPLLLVTGSRAGALIGVVGLAASMLLIRPPERQVGRGTRWWQRLLTPRGLAITGLVMLIALTIAVSRASSIARLAGADAPDEVRFKVWPVIVSAIATYFPVGSGIGSFVRVFQIAEPDAILIPTYLNHAHNDVLETLLTAGLPGAVLLLVALGGWLVAAWRILRLPVGTGRGTLLSRLGLVVIALLALGSVADYPLRTPLLAALLALATLWASCADDQSAK